MTSTDPARYRELAEAAWRWVLAQVEWPDGPRIPASVDPDTGTPTPTDDKYRDGMHEGIGGLAHLLAEVRRTRPWTGEEEVLAQAVVERLRARIPETSDISFFDGLSSTIGALLSLDEPGADAVVRRMLETMHPDGWPQRGPSTEQYLPEIRYSDTTVGTASATLAAVWAMRTDAPGARDLAERTAAVLLAEAEPADPGLRWEYIPRRFCRVATHPEMPNWSHGTAGIGAALALAGVALDDDDLVDAARLGAEHVVSVAYPSEDGLVVPLSIPPPDPARANPFSYGWCHGPTGTSLLFLALARAGVAQVAGEPTTSWYARGRQSIRTSGLPDRLRPGFWDNDGRCCGTAGVGDAFLDAYVRAGDEADLAFSVRLGDALVERAVVIGDHAYWRFVEHRDEQPLRPPRVGWMQGAAGIAAYLFRLQRVLEDGREAPSTPRMENWWALEPTP